MTKVKKLTPSTILHGMLYETLWKRNIWILKNVLVTIQKSAKKTFNNCALVPSNARKKKTTIYFTNSKYDKKQQFRTRTET